MPSGDIPKYYGIPSKQRTNSPKIVKNVEVNKPPEKIDKEKIKQNMENLKELIAKKGTYKKRPFMIEQSNNNINKISHHQFLANKNMFEQQNKIIENNLVRKDFKKKAKFHFNNFI